MATLGLTAIGGGTQSPVQLGGGPAESGGDFSAGGFSLGGASTGGGSSNVLVFAVLGVVVLLVGIVALRR